jgi:F420-non-reducing hydrogenase large subunit
MLDESGNVADAYFYATEIRGFDYFLRGMEAERLPFIISRICGVCSTAHVLGFCKSHRKRLWRRNNRNSEKLRELLLMGQIISNHSWSSFSSHFQISGFPKKKTLQKGTSSKLCGKNQK